MRLAIANVKIETLAVEGKCHEKNFYIVNLSDSFGIT
jgi:hypothetical protein